MQAINVNNGWLWLSDGDFKKRNKKLSEINLETASRSQLSKCRFDIVFYSKLNPFSFVQTPEFAFQLSFYYFCILISNRCAPIRPMITHFNPLRKRVWWWCTCTPSQLGCFSLTAQVLFISPSIASKCFRLTAHNPIHPSERNINIPNSAAHFPFSSSQNSAQSDVSIKWNIEMHNCKQINSVWDRISSGPDKVIHLKWQVVLFEERLQIREHVYRYWNCVFQLSIRCAWASMVQFRWHYARTYMEMFIPMFQFFLFSLFFLFALKC